MFRLNAATLILSSFFFFLLLSSSSFFFFLLRRESGGDHESRPSRTTTAVLGSDDARGNRGGGNGTEFGVQWGDWVVVDQHVDAGTRTRAGTHGVGFEEVNVRIVVTFCNAIDGPRKLNDSFWQVEGLCAWCDSE
jgi:hypothetical protein